MNQERLDRIVFFSKEDLSASHYLGKAEELLDKLDLSTKSEINDLLELYHIKLYFDSDLFLSKWNDATRQIYQDAVKTAFEKLKHFMLSITGADIIDTIDSIKSPEYIKSFWKLFNDLQIYKKIDRPLFSSTIQSFPHSIRHVLLFKGIVDHYDKEVKAFLMGYSKSAEILLSKFEEDRRGKAPAYNFPRSLTIPDRENILVKYIESEDANLNYIRLIEHSKESNELRLSAKTRLKAKKKSEELNKKIFDGENAPTWKFGVGIGLEKDMTQLYRFSNKDGIFEAIYSQDYLDLQQTDIALFKVFRQLFYYLNDSGLSTLVCKDSELDVMEKLFMKSKNAYPEGEVFLKKAYLSHAQILLLNQYLKPKGNSLEAVISAFANQFLNTHYNLEHLRFQLPNINSTALEKIRVLVPELEGLLRQYEIFVNEGHIDRELLELNSVPIHFNEIKSLASNKYIYVNDESINKLLFQFFSDQSSLFYVTGYESKYNNLYDLLKNEQVNFNAFKNYQQPTIKQLVAENYLLIDESNIVRIKNEILLFIVSKLHKDGVLSYWYYHKSIRSVIDELIDSNLLVAESSLFTRYEVSFYNFYLNKKEFTNGIDLRNKYLHGANPTSESGHEFEYVVLLKLIIHTLLKIEDDLMVNTLAAKQTS